MATKVNISVVQYVLENYQKKADLQSTFSNLKLIDI